MRGGSLTDEKSQLLAACMKAPLRKYRGNGPRPEVQHVDQKYFGGGLRVDQDAAGEPGYCLDVCRLHGESGRAAESGSTAFRSRALARGRPPGTAPWWRPRPVSLTIA
jgi:hypothetical protein